MYPPRFAPGERQVGGAGKEREREEWFTVVNGLTRCYLSGLLAGTGVHDMIVLVAVREQVD